MQPSTFIALNEAVDIAIDNKDKVINDWETVLKQVNSKNNDFTAVFTQYLENVPLVGRLVKKAAFARVASIYDILVNYIESHTKAHRVLKSLIEDKEFVGHILLEATRMIKLAQKYNKQNIEEVFPEVCQAIQSRTVQ